MKKREKIFVITLLLVTVIVYGVCYGVTREKGDTVVIRIDGKVWGTALLSEDQEIIVNEQLGKNVIRIQDGKVSVSEADCPDQTCADHYAIQNKNESIVCLPHKLVIEIETGKDTVQKETKDLEIDVIAE